MRTILAVVMLMCVGFCATSAATAAPPADTQTQLEAKQQELLRCQDEIRQLESSLSWTDRMAGRIERLMPTTLAGWCWFVLGLVGEFVFFLRFVVQWWASERRKRTVVPMAFWHLSLIGTGLVLAYAFYRIDPVFILAYSLNVVIYVRNLSIAKHSPALEAIAEKTSE